MQYIAIIAIILAALGGIFIAISHLKHVGASEKKFKEIDERLKKLEEK